MSGGAYTVQITEAAKGHKEVMRNGKIPSLTDNREELDEL